MTRSLILVAAILVMDVSVAVKDGVAKLKGTVPNEEARVTAATVARSTPGVRAVLWEALEIGHAR
jgi:osmotically-inducible protein OsmY